MAYWVGEHGQEYGAGKISFAGFDASVQGWTHRCSGRKNAATRLHSARFFAGRTPLCHNTACWLQPMITHQECCQFSCALDVCCVVVTVAWRVCVYTSASHEVTV